MQPLQSQGHSYVGQRLERSVAFMETLELLRGLSGEEEFAAAQEQNIIRREIIDLELCEVDHEIERICARTESYPA